MPKPQTHLASCLIFVAMYLMFLPGNAPADTDSDGPIRLPGHTLPALKEAKPLPATLSSDSEPMILTLVLKRTDQARFDQYLRDVYDRNSPIYGRFLKPAEISDRFGPTKETYKQALDYLAANGFKLVEGSANRLTLTVRGTRAQTEKAFDVRIRDFEAGSRRFFANDADPAVPRLLGSNIQAVMGLTNRPNALSAAAITEYARAQSIGASFVSSLFRAFDSVVFALVNFVSDITKATTLITTYNIHSPTGAGQKIGIPSFSSFQLSDVSDWLALAGLPPDLINKVSRVAVNGVAPLGPDQGDVLLAINTILSNAPGAQIVVYEAGPGTSFQMLFNAMIADHVTIISNSFGYCEDQTTLADVQSIDAILATASAAGITVLNATGDSGSSCSDGAADTIRVPANSPHATAVGGTTLTVGPGLTYGSEAWWDEANRVPPTGQGGFGVSLFFPLPAYQIGLISGPSRSVPDVSAVANPEMGPNVCQADAGGCPTGQAYGGTSLATPLWAAIVARINERVGHPLGFLNPLLYLLSGTSAFHSAASMSSETTVAQVGLGSPNENLLELALAGITPGPADAALSKVTVTSFPDPLVPFLGSVLADGTASASVVVELRDANGDTVTGKTVMLSAGAGSHALITPPSGVTTADNGAVVFNVRNSTVEKVTFAATDQTDGVTLTQTVDVDFTGPVPASAGISPSNQTVAADGVGAATFTVTLLDRNSHGIPNKQVSLSQGGGHARISGPNPSVTNSSGQITFAATNLVNETVTFTATDVSDGNLALPGSAVVTFTNGSGTACGQNATPPSGLNGYNVTPFASGFRAGTLVYSTVNYGGCSGVAQPLFFDNSVYVPNFLNGDLFKLDSAGGIVSNANLLSTFGPTLGWPVAGKDGRIYATRGGTGGNANTGVVLELDPGTGAIVRTVASSLTCPHSLVVDPISGDLFFDNECFGGTPSLNDSRLFRIVNPGGATPTVTAYADLLSSPPGQIVFSPDGTIYIVGKYDQASPPVYRVSGTNTPSPPTVTLLSGVASNYWLNIAQTAPDGSAQKLITLQSGRLQLVDITANPPVVTNQITNGIGGGIIGPDGCLYMPNENILYKLTDPTGGCSFLSGNAMPSISLTPALVSPDPAQGSAQSFTAQVRNVSAPAGTPITLTVIGPNMRALLARTDASGQATFTYAGAFTGTDNLVATATVGSQELTSNFAQVTWTAGTHVTFLTLNPSPRGGTPGQPVTVVAALTDISTDPTAPLLGRTISFELGGSTCNAVTGPTGLASCQLIPPGEGQYTLTAQFLTAGGFTGSTASVSFNVMSAVAEQDQIPPVLTLPAAMTVEATGPNGAVVSFNTTATDAVDPNPTVSCAPQSGAVFALGTTSVNCTASDSSGNTSAPGSFNVTVRDTTGPVLSNVPANITTPATSAAGAVVNYTTPTAGDLVSGARPVSCTPASGATFPVGTTQVSCTSTDAAGNGSTAGFSVTVQAGGNQKTICTTLGHKLLPDIDLFLFEGKAGEKVTVRLAADPSGSSRGSHAALVLFGYILLKTDASDLPNSVSVTLSKKGTYFIKVIEEWLRRDKFTGAYCVTLESSMGGSQTLRQ